MNAQPLSYTTSWLRQASRRTIAFATLAGDGRDSLIWPHRDGLKWLRLYGESMLM